MDTIRTISEFLATFAELSLSPQAIGFDLLAPCLPIFCYH